MIVDRFEYPLDGRDDVIQADLELCLCLDAPDAQVDTVEAGINPHIELEQLKYLCLERHLGPQALDLERDLLDLQLGDVKEDIRLLPAAPPVQLMLPATSIAWLVLVPVPVVLLSVSVVLLTAPVVLLATLVALAALSVLVALAVLVALLVTLAVLVVLLASPITFAVVLTALALVLIALLGFPVSTLVPVLASVVLLAVLVALLIALTILLTLLSALV